MEGVPRKYDPVAVSDSSTVVAEYVPDPRTGMAYQSEAGLEAEFISILQDQAYEYLPLHSEAELIANLRSCLEKLNNIRFSDDEWTRFYATSIASANDGIVEKTVRIQEDEIQVLTRDDGSSKNIKLIDKKHIHDNRLQVINQYEVDRGEGGAKYANRYDVTILVNGLPMVHVELKRRGVDIREAFNQIDRYQRDSFFAGSGLFEYVQLFVISNGTLTKYYSNTTRDQHIKETAAGAPKRTRKTSNSFEFTSWWADAQNKPIQDLTDFAKTFFAKHTLLNILTRFCVLTVDRVLLVMRPYQIVATERILQKIEISHNYKLYGSVQAGGYVWHTTGSGKTLTSFKTAQLASKLDYVSKVLFVVDRKDLDYQTMREYDRFEKGAANSNTSTSVLAKQLGDSQSKIIITTIQKLSTFIKTNKGHGISDEEVVIIFDECHRSQFGDMHTNIVKFFKKYYLFGFTGTPIFSANASSGGKPQLKTTEQAFGDKLHTYTIVDAITDKNVLPFRIDYISTVKMGDVIDKLVTGIDTEAVLLSPERISSIVSYILAHFDQKTKRKSSYEHGIVTNVDESSKRGKAHLASRAKRRVKGFNALFATASIDAAKQYYLEFARQQEKLSPDQKLKVGIIYSYGANDAAPDMIDDESFDTSSLSLDHRTFLENAIADYNTMFGTSYDTSGESFQNYYKDLSQRIKNREIDLVIVVNMFLTGFDATTLNTLFVDKNLQAHGLIQAYSRTNRILNSIKTYGNIVAFRDLEGATNAALELFGNKAAKGLVILKPYKDYYDEYAEKVAELTKTYSPHETPVGEKAQKAYIGLFGAILRLQNLLSSFDEFAGNEIIPAGDFQNYQSRYLDLSKIYHPKNSDKENINEDVLFEIELIKQVEVNVDYILALVDEYRKTKGDGQDKEIPVDISRAIDASPTLRNKKDLIEAFVDQISTHSDIETEWESFIESKKEEELEQIIHDERLKDVETHRYMDTAFRDGVLRTNGTAVTRILPPTSRFGSGSGNHTEKKHRVISKLDSFFDRFQGLLSRP